MASPDDMKTWGSADHAEKARELLERGHDKPAQRVHLVGEAQVHATLALYEQGNEHLDLRITRGSA